MPNFEIELLGDEDEALRHARTLLARHRHYRVVEVFAGSRSVTKLGRDPG